MPGTVNWHYMKHGTAGIAVFELCRDGTVIVSNIIDFVTMRYRETMPKAKARGLYVQMRGAGWEPMTTVEARQRGITHASVWDFYQ